jgi:hypothetical protein
MHLNKLDDRLDAVLADLNRAVELEPSNPGFRLERAESLLRANRPDDALADLEGLTREGLARVHVLRSAAFRMKGDVLHARIEKRRAIFLDPMLRDDWPEGAREASADVHP